jgi:2'-5' RNA ligase/8-oxo-dGTP pyrophosphatase MutT (NUDIX family)
VARRRLGAVAPLPEPVSIHVQAWRRALCEPTRERIVPHITLAPPQSVPEEQVPAAVALVDQAAAAGVPGVVTLHGAATFLPDSPVTYLAVTEGGQALSALEAALRAEPLGRRTHPFHPHVTVAQELPPADLEAAAADLQDFHATFQLGEIALMVQGADRVWRPLHAATVGASELVREVPVAEADSAAVFLLDPPRVLLGLRSRQPGRRYPGVWDALGGKPEPGEALLAALLREVREEADVEPLDLAPLGCFHDGDRADAFFVATTWRGQVRNTEPDEHTRLDWVVLDEAPGRAMAPTTRRALSRLVEVLGGTGAVGGTRPA